MEPVDEAIEAVQIGVDVGQRVDPTAVVVAEVVKRDDSLHFIGRHVERLPLHTSYPDVVARVAGMYARVRLRLEQSRQARRFSEGDVFYPDRMERPKLPPIRLYADATGVGLPVVELFEKAGLKPIAVWLTGGEKAEYKAREIRLSKVVLVSHLQVLLSHKRIHLPATAEVEALQRELETYEIRVNDNANLQMGAPVGKHDDLATALGLACIEAPERRLTIGSAPDVMSNWRG